MLVAWPSRGESSSNHAVPIAVTYWDLGAELKNKSGPNVHCVIPPERNVPQSLETNAWLQELHDLCLRSKIPSGLHDPQTGPR